MWYHIWWKYLLIAHSHSWLLWHHLKSHAHSIICVCRYSCAMGTTALSTVGMNPAWYDLSQSWHSIVRVISPLKGHLPAPPALSLCFCLTDFNIHSLRNYRKRSNKGQPLVLPLCQTVDVDTMLPQLKNFRAQSFWRERTCTIAGSFSRGGLFGCCKPKCGDQGSEPRRPRITPGVPFAISCCNTW